MVDVGIVSCADYSANTVDAAMASLWRSLGRDPSNPLGDIVEPGMRVFIKPNWVASRWRKSCDHSDDLFCVITHTQVIRAVADAVALALRGDGEIVIADNPSIDADFSELMAANGARELESRYDVPCTVMDLRPLVCDDLANYGQKNKMVPQVGDPRGVSVVNLGRESLLADLDPTLFRGVFNEREETVASHTGDTQLYSFSKTLFESDVYISVPKLKTHHKTGATLNLKGLVGSIGNKNQLVHWRVGSPETGGDEYPNQQALEEAKKAAVLNRGAHPGNDTIWRMVVDLYHGIHKRDRRYFTVIDGVLAGEGQGPFCPTARPAGVLLGGTSLLATDVVAARLMGMDPWAIRYLGYLLEVGEISLSDIKVHGDFAVDGTPVAGDGYFGSPSPYLDFEVTSEWTPIKVERSRSHAAC